MRGDVEDVVKNAEVEFVRTKDDLERFAKRDVRQAFVDVERAGRTGRFFDIRAVEDDVDFSLAKLDPNHIRKIDNVHVKLKAQKYDDLICAEFEITCDVTGVCSYTLQDVPLHLHFKDSLEFSSMIFSGFKSR